MYQGAGVEIGAQAAPADANARIVSITKAGRDLEDVIVPCAACHFFISIYVLPKNPKKKL